LKAVKVIAQGDDYEEEQEGGFIYKAEGVEKNVVMAGVRC